MNKTFDYIFEVMENSFVILETSLKNQPEFVELSLGKAYRYQEQNVFQALLQKLAKVQSTARGAYCLLQNGFVQEQAILHRAIDEFNEDILFLAYGITTDEVTDLHNRYLEAFWEEEIDESGNPLDSKQNRPMIPRKKIRAYIARIEGPDLGESRGVQLYKTISKAYSGFVHGASPQIMDMYGGNPPHFHIKGMKQTPRIQENTEDFINYIYRTFMSHMFVAKAFGNAKLLYELDKHKLEIEQLFEIK
ncbi:MAG: hypothetical protein KKA76_07235 [Proteobacteria bacterium]|nr:hypothetical protein [Pseudomonadota bacterium]